MKTFRTILLLGLVSFSVILPAQDAAFPSGMGEPNDGMMKHKPLAQDLGGGRYRIGSIMVDKNRKTLTLQGKMLPSDANKAIEFLATMQKGFKSYESVMTLDVNAFEFNLACILIGLDGAKTAPRFHFDPNPLQGDPVSISVSWGEGAARKTVDAVELLKVDGKKQKAPSLWNYTGSMFEPNGAYLAQMDGVLIGIIHDPASIIDHNTGLGLGNWGAITVDTEVAPKGGEKVTLTLKNMESP